jgi:hypothetical protein
MRQLLRSLVHPFLNSDTAVESYEILQQAFDKVPPKAVADALGVSLSLVYKWAQPPEEGKGSGLLNPLDRAAELMKVTRDPELIRWLCQRAGGYFVRNPGKNIERRDLAPAMNEIIQQFADLLGAISEAAADHRVSKDETQLIRRHWDELKTVTEGFVRACEEGDFDKLPRASPGA